MEGLKLSIPAWLQSSRDSTRGGFISKRVALWHGVLGWKADVYLRMAVATSFSKKKKKKAVACLLSAVSADIS